MPKSYLMVFHDWPEKTAHLSYESKGRLLEALVRYSRGDGDAEDYLQAPESFVYPVFAAEVNRANEKYEELSAKRRAAGKAGREKAHKKDLPENEEN